jgi:hypothetical protein
MDNFQGTLLMQVGLFTTLGLKSFTASKSISGFQENPGRLRLPGVFLSLAVAIS